MQQSRILLLPTVALLALAACGELDDELVHADPGFFAAQRFDCDPETATPSCPPFTCAVDETGRVFDCTESCSFDHGDSTSFEFRGPVGVDLCVPPVCTVEKENTAPRCEPGCSDDDTTLYVFAYSCT